MVVCVQVVAFQRSGQAYVPIIFGASQAGQVKKDWDLGVGGVWGQEQIEPRI